MKEKRKKTLITIVVLMVIFLPLAIGGLVVKLSGYTATSESIRSAPKNPNKDFKFQGLLYFYNDDEKLIGVYKCENAADYCDYPFESLDDEMYELDYYQDGKSDKISLINNQYAFIVDANNSSDNISLMNVVTGEDLGTFQKVKNYSKGIVGNLFIVQNLYGMWGVISLEDDLKEVIPFNYSYIGLLNKMTNDKVDADSFVVLIDSEWSIIDANKAALSIEVSNPIVSFNGEYIITKMGVDYYLYTYQATPLLDSLSYKDLSFVGKYVSVLNSNNELYLVNPETGFEMIPRSIVPYEGTYEISLEGNLVIVKINDSTNSYELVE